MRIRTSKNIFRDLGFDRHEAENLRLRAMLMVEITEYIRREGLTQEEAAKQLRVTQPRISDLMRGKIDVFSIDTLIAMLARLGMKVTIRVGRRKAA